MKTETCFASGEIQRKAHTLAVNNDQQRRDHIYTVGPQRRLLAARGTTRATLECQAEGKRHRPPAKERQRERVSESVSQWPMCQRNGC